VLDGRDLSGLRVLITGTSAGLGVETARVLAAHGAQVTGVVRDLDKARRNLDEAGATGVELYQADLASLDSVRAFTDRYLADGHDLIDLLIANAGIMACPQGTTEDGFELQFGTNHLGHFVLVNRLAPLLLTGPPARCGHVELGRAPLRRREPGRPQLRAHALRRVGRLRASQDGERPVRGRAGSPPARPGRPRHGAAPRWHPHRARSTPDRRPRSTR
jgi:NAD(P)-dependent dehydrogenase (short-subunit alcohol dehydrogenase family)